MKIFTKISLVLTAVSGGVGILLMVIGLLLGADASDLSTMGIYLSPYQQTKVSGVADNVNMSNKSRNHGNSFSDIERLEIDIPNVQITLISEEATKEITYYTNSEKELARIEGSCLKLEDESNIKNKIELEIHIPAGMLKEIDIEAANGTILADRIFADNISIEINNASVEIQELVVSNKAELQMNAGEIVVAYYKGKHLETECDAGSIQVACEGSPKDYDYELECGIGSILIDKDSYSGIGNELKIDNNSQKSIKAECSMGEVILEFPKRF